MEKIKYKLIFNNQGYIVGFYNVEDNDYDYEGDLSELPFLCEGWYRFQNNVFVVDEIKKAEIIAQREEEAKKPTWEETIEAQTFYTAMETGTLL